MSHDQPLRGDVHTSGQLVRDSLMPLADRGTCFEEYNSWPTLFLQSKALILGTVDAI